MRITDVKLIVIEYLSLLRTLPRTGRLSTWESPRSRRARLNQYFANRVSKKKIRTRSSPDQLQRSSFCLYQRSHSFWTSASRASLSLGP